MKTFFKISSPWLALAIIFGIGCNNSADENSAYANILSQAPYASLTDSIRQNGKEPELYYHRGRLLKQNDLQEPALADFKKAWSMGKREEYAANISNLLLSKNPDSAIAFIDNALQQLPSSIFLQLDLARAYHALNQVDNALRVCDNIIQKNPGQIDAMLLKSDLLGAKNDTTGSIQALERAYALAPFDVELNYDLAFKYAQSKNPRTLSLCDSLITKDSLGNHAEPYYFKGVYYANINDNKNALDYFNKAIRHDYNFLDAYLDKGRILFNQKNITEALKTFKLAATISPSFADAYFWMAKCEEALGQKADAKADYQRAYGFDKTLTEAKKAADSL
jgi:tetratricopeptide (TPR) repeat protein